MKYIWTEEITLHPNKEQLARLNNTELACIASYNWALDAVTDWYKAYKEGSRPDKPNKRALSALFTEYRRQHAELQSCNCAAEHRAVSDLWTAYINWWGRGKKHPKQHQYGYRGSFYGLNQQCHLDIAHKRVFMSKIGYIKMSDMPRYNGKILSYTFVRHGIKIQKWNIAITYELDEDPRPQPTVHNKVLGFDAGIGKVFGVDSDGTVYYRPDVSKKERKKQYYQRKLDRQLRGSKNYQRTEIKIARLNAKIDNTIRDATHKTSNAIAKKADVIVIEDLGVKKMQKSAKGTSPKSRGFRHSLHNARLSELLRQIKYKAKNCIEAERYFASTQICCVCGSHHKMDLSDRVYVCHNCGLIMDRDLNAAKNLRDYGILELIQACQACSMPIIVVADNLQQCDGENSSIHDRREAYSILNLFTGEL